MTEIASASHEHDGLDGAHSLNDAPKRTRYESTVVLLGTTTFFERTGRLALVMLGRFSTGDEVEACRWGFCCD